VHLCAPSLTGSWMLKHLRADAARLWITLRPVDERSTASSLSCKFITVSSAFRGSEAIAAGLVTRKQLAGPRYQRVFRDVYVPATVALTHELRCACAALILPPDAVITGRSAAALRGIPLPLPNDPIEVVAGLETRLFRRTGLDLRRCELRADEAQPWSRIRVATRRRAAFDLLLDRPLSDAVADLDAVMRAALVGRAEMQVYLRDRHDRGIV
jgi:hypothetical protein